MGYRTGAKENIQVETGERLPVVSSVRGCDGLEEHLLHWAELVPGEEQDADHILHELNNTLAGILLNAELLAWKSPSYAHSKHSLNEIVRNAMRGGQLVRRLAQASAVAVAPPPKRRARKTGMRSKPGLQPGQK